MKETLYCLVDKRGYFYSGIALDKESPLGFKIDVNREIAGAKLVSEKYVGVGAAGQAEEMLKTAGFKRLKVTVEVEEADGTPYRQSDEKVTFKDILKDLIENGDI